MNREKSNRRVDLDPNQLLKTKTEFQIFTLDGGDDWFQNRSEHKQFHIGENIIDITINGRIVKKKESHRLLLRI